MADNNNNNNNNKHAYAGIQCLFYTWKSPVGTPGTAALILLPAPLTQLN
jgi:hypothetical protein